MVKDIPMLQSSREMIRMRNELNEKISETSRLQMELRLQSEDAPDVGSLKQVIATLEKENAALRVRYFWHQDILFLFMPNILSLECQFIGFCASNIFWCQIISVVGEE